MKNFTKILQLAHDSLKAKMIVFKYQYIVAQLNIFNLLYSI